MTAWIKIHFPRCKQTEVFVSPLERALACEGSSEGKSCKAPPRKPKGSYSKLSRKTFHGKQNSGTRRWFVFFACWLKKYSQKCHSTCFFFSLSFFLKPQTNKKSTSVVTLHFSSWQLPGLWIKMTSVLVFASTSKTQKAVISKLPLFRQTTSLSRNKVHRWKCIPTFRTEPWAQAGSDWKTPANFAWTYPFYLNSKIPRSNFSSFLSNQPQPCYMRCSVLKHGKKKI